MLSKKVANAARVKKRLVSDLGRPKHPLSALNLFVRDSMAGKAKKDQAEQTKLFSWHVDRFRALSEAERAPYEQEAAKRKEEYKR